MLLDNSKIYVALAGNVICGSMCVIDHTPIDCSHRNNILGQEPEDRGLIGHGITRPLACVSTPGHFNDKTILINIKKYNDERKHHHHPHIGS